MKNMIDGLNRKLCMLILTLLFLWMCSASAMAANVYAINIQAIPELEKQDAKIQNYLIENNKMFSSRWIKSASYYNDELFTKTEVKNMIKEVAKRATRSDYVFFQYTGHGESIVTKTGLSLSTTYEFCDLVNDLNEINCDHIFVNLMACHSGGMIRALSNNTSVERRKFFVYTSSTEDRNSWFQKEDGISYFNFALAIATGYYGVAEADLNSDHIVSAKELRDTIRKKVEEIERSTSDEPEYPQFYNAGSPETVLEKQPVFQYQLNGIKISLSGNLLVGQTKELDIKYDGAVSPKEEAATLWVSSDTSIATVNKDGVTGKKAGTVTITAICGGKAATCRVTVLKPTVTLSSSSLTMKVSSQNKLHAIIKNGYGKGKWKSNHPSVVKITSSKCSGTYQWCKLKAVKPGKATISYTIQGVTKKCVVTVKPKTCNDVYKELLKKTSIKAGSAKISTDYYLIKNVDQKGSPELIIASKKNLKKRYMYTFSKGKAVYCGCWYDYGTGGAPWICYSSSKKGMISEYGNTTTKYYRELYCLSGNKLKKKYTAYQHSTVKNGWYYIGSNYRSVSATAFFNYVNQYTNGKSIQMKKNNYR